MHGQAKDNCAHVALCFTKDRRLLEPDPITHLVLGFLQNLNLVSQLPNRLCVVQFGCDLRSRHVRVG